MQHHNDYIYYRAKHVKMDEVRYYFFTVFKKIDYSEEVRGTSHRDASLVIVLFKLVSTKQ